MALRPMFLLSLDILRRSSYEIFFDKSRLSNVPKLFQDLILLTSPQPHYSQMTSKIPGGCVEEDHGTFAEMKFCAFWENVSNDP